MNKFITKRIHSILFLDTINGRFQEPTIYSLFPNRLFIELNFTLRRFLFDTLYTFLNHYELTMEEKISIYKLYKDSKLLKYILMIETIRNNGYLNRYHFKGTDITDLYSIYSNITHTKSAKNIYKSSLLWEKAGIEKMNKTSALQKHNNPVLILEPEIMPVVFFQEISNINKQIIFICQNIKQAISLCGEANTNNLSS